MKTNRILFAITLITPPLLLTAYNAGSTLRPTGVSTLTNNSGTLRSVGGSTLTGSTSAKPASAGIVAPNSGKTPVLGQEYRDDKRRYFGTQQERRTPGMVTPLRK